MADNRKRFTSESAREMQRLSAEKRKENTAFRRDCKAILLDILNDKYKTEDGKEIDGRTLLMTKLFKGAFINGDLPSIKYICEMIGEAPAQQIDVTTGGNPLNDNPYMVMPFEELQRLMESTMTK